MGDISRRTITVSYNSSFPLWVRLKGDRTAVLGDAHALGDLRASGYHPSASHLQHFPTYTYDVVGPTSPILHIPPAKKVKLNLQTAVAPETSFGIQLKVSFQVLNIGHDHS